VYELINFVNAHGKQRVRSKGLREQTDGWTNQHQQYELFMVQLYVSADKISSRL